MFTVKVQGFAELDRALSELPKSVAKGVLLRALKKAAQPVLDSAVASVPVRTAGLMQSLAISTRLTQWQRRGRFGRLAPVEVFIGPTYPKGAHGHLVEFGSIRNIARPFMRPAWESNKDRVLKILTDEIRNEINKAVKRIVKRYGSR